MKAYELIDTSEKWCQGYQAENKLGRAVYYYDDAVKFCVVGAIWKTYGTGLDADSCINKLQGLVGPLSEWNDRFGRTQKEVYDLLKSLDI